MATRITGRNVKGSSFEHLLAPVNIIVGDNASGKSAIAEAIKIGIVGYSLKTGKLPGATFKLASGPAMDIELDFDDGLKNAIHFCLGKKGLVSSTSLAVKSPGILMDINDYFGRSGTERSKFLFNLAGAGTAFTVGELTAAVKNVQWTEPRKLGEAAKDQLRHSADSEAIIAELCEIIDDADSAREEMGQPLDQWFSALIDGFKKRLANTDAVVKQMRNSIQASVALQTAGGMPAAVRPGIEAELVTAREFMEGLRWDLGKIQGLVAEVERAKAQRAAAEKELANCAEPVDDLDRFNTALGLAESALAQLEADKGTGELADYQAAVKAAENTINAIGFSEVKTQKRVSNQTAIHTALVAAENQIQASREAIASLDGRLGSCCPKCGAAAEHWSDEIRTKAKDDLSGHRRALASLEKALPDIQAKRTSIDELVHEDNVNRAKHTLALRLFYEAGRACQKYEGAWQLGVMAKKQAAQLAVNNARTCLHNRSNEISNARDKRASAQRRLASLPFVECEEDRALKLCEEFCPTEKGSTIAEIIDLMERTITKQMERVRVLESEHREALKAQAAAAQREQAKVELEANELRRQITAAALKALTEKQSAVIENGIKGFMAKAGTLTEAVLGMRMEFRDGEIGMWRGPQWVEFSTFSGAEEYLAVAGLCLAFAPTAPCKLIVIDELGRLDAHNKRLLIERMLVLTADGTVDNFVGIDVARSDYNWPFCDGVNVIEVKR